MSYITKEARPRLSDVMNGWKYLAGAGIGGFSASESGAAFRGEDSIVNLKPAIFRIGSDPHVRRDVLWGAGLGAGGAGMRGPTWPGVVVGGIGGGSVEVMGMNYLTNVVRANELAAQANGNAQKEIEAKNTQTAILGVLGTAALGLGGYALYKYLSNKKEEKAAPPKVKVRIKGNSRDPYDDATVEVPLHNLKVTENLERGVNRSMRRVIRDNNLFSSKKKDPFTGKLISYEEYTSKYGDPKQKKKKKTFSDGSIPFTSNSSPQIYQKPTVDKETDYINPITSYDQNNESI